MRNKYSSFGEIVEDLREETSQTPELWHLMIINAKEFLVETLACPIEDITLDNLIQMLEEEIELKGLKYLIMKNKQIVKTTYHYLN